MSEAADEGNLAPRGKPEIMQLLEYAVNQVVQDFLHPHDEGPPKSCGPLSGTPQKNGLRIFGCILAPNSGQTDRLISWLVD